MRVLLDECVPKRLGRHLAPHECRMPAQLGWDGIMNGRLLALAEKEFDELVTMDRNLSFQQSLPKSLPPRRPLLQNLNCGFAGLVPTGNLPA